MSIQDPKALTSLLQDYGSADGLRKIVRQAQRLLATDQIIAAFLPENLQSHCQTAQVTATAITIIVDSAAWLTHLRYLKPQLLQQLKTQPQCVNLKDIIFRIQPQQMVEAVKIPPTHSHRLSADSKELLRSTAEAIHHRELKTALLKLAS